MRKSIQSIVVAACLFIVAAAQAQTFSFRHFGVEEGLAGSTVYDVLQDSKGYMWFATETGVNRFDGYTFTTFTTNDGLWENEVLNICEDKSGRIWFRSIAGKLCYYSDGKIVRFTEGSLDNYRVESMFNDCEGNLWFPTENNLVFVVPLASGKPIGYPGDQYGRSSVACQLKNGRYWGIFVVNNKPIVTSFKDISSPIYYKHLVSNSSSSSADFIFLEEDENSVLVLYGDTVHQYNEKGLIKRYMLPSGKCGVNMMRDRQKNLWIATRSGVLFYAGGNLDSKPEVFFPEYVVSAVREDQEGHIWITTLEDGVFMVSTENRNYRVYSHIEALSNKRVMEVEGDRAGNIWAAAQDGSIAIFGEKSVSMIRLRNEGPVSKLIKEITFYKGRAYICRDDGVTIINESGDQFKVKSFESAAKSASIYKDSMILLAISSGIVNLDLRNFKRINNKHILIGRSYYSFTDLSGDKIWLGTVHGLACYRYDTVMFMKESIPLLAARINGIAQDHKGTLWLATHEKGLIGLNSGKIVAHIQQDNGLSSNICNAVFVDKDQSIWLSTNKGANKIVFGSGGYQHYKVTIINARKGLISDEVNDIYKEGNTVWIATNRGLVSIDEANIKPNTVPPPVYLTHLKIWEKDTALFSKYQLNHTQNNIRIEFVGLTYSNPGQVRYRYRMLGIDSGWTYSNTAFASYPILPHGNYRFEVQASNEDGYWSKDPASLRITITPPFYKRTWFITLAALVFGISLFTIIYLRIRRIKHKEKEKAELSKRISGLEMDALRAQINPHFIFNALNSIQHFISENNGDSAHKYLAKFARLIRMTLEHARKPNILMSEELEALELYLKLESLRFSDKFSYQISVDPKIDPDNTEIPHMLIQPFVENSIWHGLMHKATPGKIHIGFKIKDDRMICTIEDNGIGRAKAADLKSRINVKNSKSRGIEITKARLDILNKMQVSRQIGETTVHVLDLFNQHQESIGTKVEIAFPLLN